MQVEIKYNPYLVKTNMSVDGKDVMKDPSYSKFKKYIEQDIPLQNWIDPIAVEEWEGFGRELERIAEGGEGVIDLTFHGRRLDFEDLKQSAARQCGGATQFKYVLDETLDDRTVEEQIDTTVEMMCSEKFKKIIKDLRLDEDEAFKTAYDNLHANYGLAKNKEFRIVFAGIYNSGKSTLINALIGKQILPMADGTCTSKVFQIYHKPGVTFAEMGCTGGMESNRSGTHWSIPLEEYKDETALQEKFAELFSQAESANPLEIETVRIYTDLAHLYPEGFENKFQLVLVDTPGTNSGEGNNEGEKATPEAMDQPIKDHLEITLDAIKSKNKEMVVLLALGKQATATDLSGLIKTIEESIKADKGTYDQRFLFVLNQCDDVTFQSKNTEDPVDEKIREFRRRIQVNASSMKSPRIFLSAAAAALAIKKGRTSEDYVDTQEDQNHYGKYDQFKRVCTRKIKPEYYFFERKCSTSDRIKAKLTEQLEQEQADESMRVLIHSGIPSLEMAIQEYIERYAYPLKVQSLLETFLSILSQTDCWSNRVRELLEQSMSKLEVLDQKKKEEADAEQRKEALKKVDKIIDKQILKLEAITPNKNAIEVLSSELSRDLGDAKAKIDASEDYPSLNIAQDKLDEIKELIQSGIDKLEDALPRIQEESQKQFQKIHAQVLNAMQELESLGLLNVGGFDFKSTVIYEKINRSTRTLNFDNIDVISETVSARRGNPEKYRTYHWFQFIKKIQQAVAPAFITKSEHIFKLPVKDLNEFITKIKVEYNMCVTNMYETTTAQVEWLKKVTKENIGLLRKAIQETSGRLSGLEHEMEQLVREGAAEERFAQLKEYSKYVNQIKTHITKMV